MQLQIAGYTIWVRDHKLLPLIFRVREVAPVGAVPACSSIRAALVWSSLRLRLRLMTTKRCSSRDETLRPLVQTASPTLCGNVASASISRYTLSSAEFGAQLTFLRLGSVLRSVYSINPAQRTIHPTSAQLPYQTAKAKCSSPLSARQSCGTCSGTRFLTSASRRGFCLT